VNENYHVRKTRKWITAVCTSASKLYCAYRLYISCGITLPHG